MVTDYSGADPAMIADAVYALDEVQAGYALAWLAGHEPALVARAIAAVMGVQSRVAQSKARHYA